MKKNLYLIRNGLIFILFILFAFQANAQNVKDARITINNFQVVKNHNKIAIRWAADEASLTNYFEVEKSNDGKNFKTIAYVLGADPAQKDCECFGCFDKINDKTGEAYYRLKHVSINGIVQFSEIKLLALK